MGAGVEVAHRQPLLEVNAHELSPIAFVERPIDLGQHALRRLALALGLG